MVLLPPRLTMLGSSGGALTDGKLVPPTGGGGEDVGGSPGRYDGGMETERPDRRHALTLASRRLPGARTLASALESVPRGVLVLDRERRIVYRNFRFAELFGLPPDVAASADWEELVRLAHEHLEDPEVFRDDFEQLAEEPERIRHRTARLRDGRLVERELRPRYGPDGLAGWLALYREVTDEAAERQDRDRLEARLRRLFEANVAGAFRASFDGELLRCNDAFAEILGYDTPEAATELDLARLFVGSGAWERLRGTLQERGEVRGEEVAVKRRDGSPALLRQNAALIEDWRHDRPVIEGTVLDVTPRRELEAEVRQRASYDPLTGLSNRRMLAERARRARHAADRTGAPFAVLRLEVVERPELDDEARERLLVELARRIEGALREVDTAGREEGEVFVVLLPEVDGRNGARTAALRVAEAVRAPLSVAGRSLSVDVRAGIALYPEHGSTLTELLARADEASERGAAGGDRVAVAGDVADEPPTLTPERLERALAEDELVLHYQPVYDLSDGRLVGAEALVRWEHPDRGVLPAAAFVPLAERSGLIRRIDRLVVESALRQHAAWIGGPEPDWVAVRLSAATALDAGTAAELQRWASEHGTPLDRLMLELRRRDVEADGEEGLAAVRRLREAGCSVALRGFALDRATLARLRHPSDAVRACDVLLLEGTRTEDPSLLEDIVRHGHELGLRIATVGIEAPEQVTWIGSSGGDLIQGYALGRPVPPEAFPPDGT